MNNPTFEAHLSVIQKEKDNGHANMDNKTFQTKPYWYFQ